MIRRPPRSTLDRSSAASDVYKRQDQHHAEDDVEEPEQSARGEHAEGQTTVATESLSFHQNRCSLARVASIVALALLATAPPAAAAKRVYALVVTGEQPATVRGRGAVGLYVPGQGLYVS